MKKIIAFLAALAIVAGALVGCGGTTTKAKYTVVCTIFPQYDWVREIVGDNSDVEVKLMASSGVDLHNYQPSVKDIVAISTCDMFLYVGGPSDEWAEDVLKDRRNKDMVIINLFDVLGDKVKEEEHIEGAEEDHDHAGVEEDHDHDHDHEHEYDEHVWLSLKNALFITEQIKDRLCEMDEQNAAKYTENAKAYCDKLTALDERYASAVSAAEKNTLLLADRFPFRYLVDDYGLKYYAAFSGCSAESNASFSTITFLAGKVDELGLNSIIILEGSDGKIAQSVISNTKDKNQTVLKMDSLQSISAADVDKGKTYLSVMESNLETIKSVLGA